MLKVILFDWDGTICNSIPNIKEAYKNTGSRINLSHFPYEKLRQLIGVPTRIQANIICPSNPDLFVEIYGEEYKKLPNADIYEHSKETISDLTELGYKIALVTSKTRNSVTKNLNTTGLYEYFDFLVCGDEVENPKPHPEPILKALEYYNIEPSEAIYIGDSLHDINSAKAAKVQVIGVTWGAKYKDEIEAGNPDYIATSWDNVISICKSIR